MQSLFSALSFKFNLLNIYNFKWKVKGYQCLTDLMQFHTLCLIIHTLTMHFYCCQVYDQLRDTNSMSFIMNSLNE